MNIIMSMTLVVYFGVLLFMYSVLLLHSFCL